MKQRASILTAAVLSLAVLTACNNQGAQDTPATDTAATDDTAMVDDPNAAASENDPLLAEGAAAPAAMVNERDALGIVAAVNEHEIAAAEQARAKNVSAPVAAYADMMAKEHAANMEKLRALEGSANVQSGSGPQVESLRTETENARNRLMGMQGQDYERAYVEQMVNDHQKTLTMLETQLIPGAQDAAVRTFLTQTRDAVAKHLEAARQLQSQLGGNTNAAAPTQS